MKIQYFATLREITRKREEDWNPPASTLRELMTGLIARYGYRFERWVVEDGELCGLAVILVDGRDVRHTRRSRHAAAAGIRNLHLPACGGRIERLIFRCNRPHFRSSHS